MKFIKISALGVILMVGGCSSYNQLAITQEGNSFEELRMKQDYVFPTEITSLTLEEAQRLALQNNPDFLSVKFAIDSAQAKYYQSYSSYAPTLNASFSLSQRFNKVFSSDNSSKSRSQTDTYSPALSGQLLIFDCLSREMNILSTKYQLEESKNNMDDAKRLLLRAVAYAYNEVLLAEAQLKIVLAEIEYSKKMLSETEDKYNAGTALLSDVLNFKISLENGRLARIAANYNIESSKFVLAGYLGIIDGTIPGDINLPEATIPEDEVMPSVEIFIDQALINRPDILAYRNRLKSAEYDYKGSWGSFGPTISANYSIGATATHSVYHNSSSTGGKSTSGYVDYGINADWNLFNGFYDYYQIKALKASMAEIDYMLAQELINVVTEVRTAYANYNTSVKEAKWSKAICDLTLETRDLVDSEYKAGTALVTRVNEAESALVTAQNNYVTSVINISNAKAQLEAAVFAIKETNEVK